MCDMLTWYLERESTSVINFKRTSAQDHEVDRMGNTKLQPRLEYKLSKLEGKDLFSQYYLQMKGVKIMKRQNSLLNMSKEPGKCEERNEAQNNKNCVSELWKCK